MARDRANMVIEMSDVLPSSLIWFESSICFVCLWSNGKCIYIAVHTTYEDPAMQGTNLLTGGSLDSVFWIQGPKELALQLHHYLLCHHRLYNDHGCELCSEAKGGRQLHLVVSYSREGESRSIIKDL